MIEELIELDAPAPSGPLVLSHGIEADHDWEKAARRFKVSPKKRGAGTPESAEKSNGQRNAF